MSDINSKAGMTNTISRPSLLFLGVMLLCFTWLLYESGLLLIWLEDEEYGHGMMVVGLLGYFLYRNRNALLTDPVIARWAGILISLSALLMFILGEASGIAPIRMYSIWVFALGATFAIGGWGLFKKLVIPLGIIFLLIPLPNVLGPMLTSQLQLISSKLGVLVIRLFGGVVFLEGNVIDMGGVKLLVAEACAGLRYLFPLMSIGAIAGFIMRAPVWMRWSVFLATIPVTILMNSIRIGITGLLVEGYGMSHTEGFLHFFEGWVVFVASLVVLVSFAWLLLKLVPGPQSMSRVFSFDHFPGAEHTSQSAPGNRAWQTAPAALIMLGCLVVAVIGSNPFISRGKAEIVSKPLSEFPLMLGNWQASQSRLLASIVATVDASDYYYGNFTSPTGEAINLYISYYEDQKLGPAPHSPKLCIPGDGWLIRDEQPVTLKTRTGVSITVNRLMITKGDNTTIAYYWLKQGSRVFRQQYMARLDLLRFSIMENRADAALIRMVTTIGKNEKIEDGDARLQQVATELLSVVADYVPD